MDAEDLFAPSAEDLFAPSVEGTWSGYVEAHTFPSGSDLLKLEIECLPESGFAFSEEDGCALHLNTGATVPIDCGRLQLCEMERVCACDAMKCSASSERALTFDITLDGTSADGTLAGLGDALNVRMERD